LTQKPRGVDAQPGNGAVYQKKHKKDKNNSKNKLELDYYIENGIEVNESAKNLTKKTFRR